MTGASKVEPQGVLPPDREQVLIDWELYSTPTSNLPHLAHLYDCDGYLVATVTRAISAADLNAMMRYGQQMHSRGRTCGEEHIKATLRACIGAQATKG